MLYASVKKYNDIAAHLCNRVVDFLDYFLVYF